MIKNYFNEIIDLNEQIKSNKNLLNQIDNIILCLTMCLCSGNKILIAGNGGSASDAQHFAAEIVGRYKKERNGYPAIDLSSNNSVVTACGNDYGFSSIFSRQVEAFGNNGDVLVLFSTSGNSVNLIQAFKMAKKKGLATIAFLGKGGGKLKNSCNLEFIVPSNDTARIQEIHASLIHIICEELENKLI